MITPTLQQLNYVFTNVGTLLDISYTHYMFP